VLGGASRGATAGGLAAGCAWAAQQALGVFDLYFTAIFTACATIAAALLGVLADRHRAVRERAREERELDALLACYPPPTVAGADPYDLGAIAGPGFPDSERWTPYVARPEVDERLARLLDEHDLVVVTGGPGVGKSRAAFQAMLAAYPDRRLLVPENGSALATLLADHLPALTAPHAGVLWLDDLPRFLDGLEVDGLDCLRSAGVSVVCTARADDLRGLREAASDVGRAARRLLGRAAVVDVSTAEPVEGWFPPSAIEWERPLCAGTGTVRTPPRTRDDPGMRAALGALAALGLVLALLAASGQALKPRPLQEQLADVRRAAARCSPVELEPRPTSAVQEGSVFFLIVHAARGCGRSDEIRVLRVAHGRLVTVDDVRPGASLGGEYRLVCRGQRPGSECVFPGAAGDVDPMLVAGWQDTATGLIYPFALYRRGGAYALAPLRSRALPRVTEAPRSGRAARRQYGRPVGISAGDGVLMRGWPVDDFAVVEGAGPLQVVLGYVWRGPYDAPGAVQIAPTRMVVDQVPHLAPCPTVQEPHASPGYVRRVPPRETDRSTLLRRRWAAGLRHDPDVCDG